MMRRHAFIFWLCILLPGLLSPAAAAEGSEPFDYAWLKGRARTLAAAPYVSHEGELPKVLQNLSWDAYQQIRFDRGHALWRKDDSLFRAELFHLGLYFRTPVTIYELENGRAAQIPYSRDLFQYGKSGLKGAHLPKDLGFAGFRFLYHTDWERDLVAFQGFKYENISFEIENGKIVKATANNEERINNLLDTDEGARYFGEFAIGVNPFVLEPMLDILFDEKIAGSFHFTPGMAYEDANNGNKSAIHWDLVMIQRPEYGGGEIWFDDKLIRKDGMFVIDELKCLNPENLK